MREKIQLTPTDIMHKIKTRLTHNCATAEEPIRDCDYDLEHILEEINEIQDHMEDIQVELCNLYGPENRNNELNTLLTHIRAHLDEAHYLLRDRGNMGTMSSNKMHNEIMNTMRRKIRNSYMEHYNTYKNDYSNYNLGMDA